MKNFYRTLRMVFRYKWTLAASTFTAIMVALLWGLNITGAYPVLAVISSNKSLQEWIRDDITQTQTRIDALTAKAGQLEAEIKDDEQGRRRIQKTIRLMRRRQIRRHR